MKILVCDKLAPPGIEVLKKAGLQVIEKTKLSLEELKKEIADVEAVIVRSQTKLTKEVLECAKNLKVIGRAGVGLDNIDVETATRLGIIVMNAPGANTISTAEHTFGLILSMMRNIPQSFNSLLQGKWERSKFLGEELYGKTLGIIGLGRIGSEVAKRALSFKMRVLAYDPFISEEVVKKIEVQLTDFETLLRESDIITIHVPLTPETKNMISEKEFSLMKDGVKIVNCARGGIVNEEALIKALESGKVKKCALDVFETEPLPASHPILKFSDRVVLTPHLGASTQEAQVNVAIEIAKNVVDALMGRQIRNAINIVSLDFKTYKVLEPYIKLAEKMGIMSSQLVPFRVNKIRITFSGLLTEYKLDPLSSAFLKGFLTPIIEENVNYINAKEICKERGIETEIVTSSKKSEFLNTIQAELISDKEEKKITGTVFGKESLRIVRIDEFYVEIIPQGYLLFILNMDKPGVIGNIGTILGKKNINIGGMSLGRESPGGKALTVLNIDQKVSKEVLEELKSLDNVLDVRFLEL